MHFRNARRGERRGGYVAVVSAVVVTAIVLMTALVFSSANFLGRFDTQNLEAKDMAREVAEGCLAHARLKLAQGSYSGGEVKTVGNYTCTILPVLTVGNEKIIKATATVGGQTANLSLTVDAATLEATSRSESSSF